MDRKITLVLSFIIFIIAIIGYIANINYKVDTHGLDLSNIYTNDNKKEEEDTVSEKEAVEGIAKSNVIAYINAVEYNNALAELEDDVPEKDRKYTKITSGDISKSIEILGKNLRGKIPNYGTIVVDENGKVKEATLVYSSYTCIVNNNDIKCTTNK